MAINSLIAQFGQNTFSGVGAAVDSANQAQQQRVRNAFAQREQEQQDTEFAQGQEDRQTAQQKVQQKEHMLTVYAEAKATKDPAQWAEKARTLATDEQDYNALIQAGPDETARVLGIHLGIPEDKPQNVAPGGALVQDGKEVYRNPREAKEPQFTFEQQKELRMAGRAPAKRQVAPDQNGISRYVDTGEAVFPDVKKDPTLAKTSEGEKSAAGYLGRMLSAEQRLVGLGDFDPTSLGETLKGQSNVTASPKYQQYKQAANDWIRAKLRKESGAVIAADEMQREYETYFPIFGDSPEVIQQKAAARADARQQMRIGSGRAAPTSGASGNWDDAAYEEKKRQLLTP